jgi:hypothetical protein
MADSIRGTRNGSGASIMTHPLTRHEFYRGIMQDKTFYQDMTDNRDFNAWKENINAVTQMDCIHNVPNENHVSKDDRE